DMNLVIDQKMNVTLTWTAPTASLNFGPITDSNIRYNVVRYPDGVQVATGIKDTFFKEKLGDARKNYYYEVTALNGSLVGESAVSEVVPAGSVWYLPYNEPFYYEQNYNIFTVIDNNGDGQTFTWMKVLDNPDLAKVYMNGNGVTSDLTGFTSTHNDDYLITPSISFEAGKDYYISFDWETHYDYETMNIFLGKGNAINDSISEITPSFQLGAYEGKSSFIFHVENDGLYNIFLHSTTVGNSVNVALDNLCVELAACYEAPDSVTNLSVKAGELGKLENTLSFTAPTKTYKQGALSEISAINIYRNGSTEPVKVFSNPAPGASLTWTDTEVNNGSVTYQIVPVNSKGQGLTTSVTNWVGIDVPAEIATLTGKQIYENDMWVPQFTFEKVSGIGAHGGYVNPDDVEYALFKHNVYNFEDPIEQVTEYSKNLTIAHTDYFGYGQSMCTYYIGAKNAAGTSIIAGTDLIVGEPYEFPYSESFAYGFAGLDPWTRYNSSSEYAWSFVTGSGLAVKPYDCDEGMLMFTYSDNISQDETLGGPRVSLKNTTSPELSFYMYHGFEADPEDLTLDVYLNYQDEGWKLAGNVDYNTGVVGWTRYSIPLRNDASDVQFAFAANAIDASAPIFVDAIKVNESVETEIAAVNISINEKRIEAGESTKVKVSVTNYGTKSLSDYNVTLYRNGEEYAQKSGSELAQNSVNILSFDINTTKAEAGEEYEYYATVNIDGDSNPDNNITGKIRLFIHGSVLPEVEIAGQENNGNVILNWETPSDLDVLDPVTEDFESYDAFIIDNIGDWKVYDGDGTPVVFIGNTAWAHAAEPMAWQVWSATEVGYSTEQFPVLKAHSGEKVLACWAASDGVSTTLSNDDWFISSDVKGGTDVSFFYRKPHSGSDPQVFEMMYSTTDQEPENFIAFDRDSIVSSTDWIEFNYTLPKSAKFFAIRSCCSGSYTVAFLDDITYTALYGSYSTVEVKGYNVYRDNELIANNLTTTSFTDENAAGADHIYAVTAIYAEGESNYSNLYGTGALNIKDVKEAFCANVTTSNGIISVSNVDGKDVTLYDMSGKQIYNVKAVEAVNVKVEPGIYVVRVGNANMKVYVNL
nr:hypothetical protein [Bacteroidaceae bacterium]